MNRDASDSGAATVLALIAATTIGLSVVALGLLTLVLFAQHRAASAADLAALAGAQHLAEGHDAACAAAAAVARANHTVLLRCDLDEQSVSVSVGVSPSTTSAWWGAFADQVIGRARAGYAPSGS